MSVSLRIMTICIRNFYWRCTVDQPAAIITQNYLLGVTVVTMIILHPRQCTSCATVTADVLLFKKLKMLVRE